MNDQELWESYRSWLFDDRELNFRLDLSRMEIPAKFMERMAPVISKAFGEMQELERGAIANPDEHRQVGHYWLRAPDLAPDDRITQEIRETQEKILGFARRVHRAEVRPVRAERFEHLLVVGIGGSALGPQFVADALGGLEDPMKPHFLDNTDPDGIDRVLGGLPVDRTLTVVVSKSGSTAETRNGMLETEEVYRAAGLEFGPHAVAITQEESKLDRTARKQGFLERFPMWDWVGGRTSELSAVGLLPAALQGFDVNAMLEGAATMDQRTRRPEATQNPAALLALAWYHAGDGQGLKDMVILPYRDRLALFSRYLQQLVMESLGKKKNLDGKVVHQGIAVYGNKGSTDQHAYVQQLRDGIANFFVTFIEVLRDRDRKSIEVDDGFTSGDYLQGFLIGTRRALFESGRRSMTVTIGDVSPRSVGMLIALYERAVGLYASMIQINAYNQPGVEAGKKAAAAVLALQAALMRALEEQGPAGATCEELAAAAGAPDEVETAFMILDRLAANPVRGVVRQNGTTAFDARYRFLRAENA